jgi:hypothetical protein
VILNKVIRELKDAKYVSLMLDRSLTAGTEELILYVRYIKNIGVRTVFQSVLPFYNATADGN